MNSTSNRHRRILVIEDEPGLRRTLSDYLVSQRYLVQTTGDGVEGERLACAENFDLIILDVMLPSRSGFDVCRNLRREGLTTPILMLTARSELNNKVRGLNAGSDDYLTKPFEIPELKARIEALLRRSSATPPRSLKFYDFGNIHVDFVHSRIMRNGNTITLSEREARLLQYFVEHRNVIVTRDEILERVWGYGEAPFTRTVDVHVVSLRQKIEADPKKPEFILTVYGEGYRFAG